MLLRVHVEHEVDERAGQVRALAEQDRKACTRHLRRALKIQNAQGGPQIPVRDRLKIKLLRLAPRAHDLVVGVALAHRDALVRQVRQRHQQRRSLVLDLVELDAELADLLRPLAIRLENRARVFALPLRARDFVARGILLALQPLELGYQPAPSVLERRKRFEVAVDVHAALVKPSTHLVRVVAHENRVKHDEILQ